jgi:hypothetical protein
MSFFQNKLRSSEIAESMERREYNGFDAIVIEMFLKML